MHLNHHGASDGFVALRVADIHRSGADALRVEFDMPSRTAADFAYLHGQHLTLRARIDGQDVRRSYSICRAEHERRLSIAVRLVEGGVFSGWLAGSVSAGDFIEVSPPAGRFNIALRPELARRHLAIAAGSGIAPLLSISATLLHAEPLSEVMLVVGNRDEASVMLGEEIAALKNRYMRRFSVLHVFSRERHAVELMNGRLDAGKLQALFDGFIELEKTDHVFICGPGPMMGVLRDELGRRGVDASRLHAEVFAGAAARAAAAPRRRGAASSIARARLEVVHDGARRLARVEDADATLLDGALAAGIEIPHSCRRGVCGTCRCRLVEGEVEHLFDFALDESERRRGVILACGCRGASPSVVLDFDNP